MQLQKEPRRYSAGKIVFAGIKKNCKNCYSSVHNHFKHHKVVHLHCKFCFYQMQTAFDKSFWDKVCTLCGKVCQSIEALKYWHKRIHDLDWKCEDCDVFFNRKWTLKRHLREIHKLNIEDDETDEHSVEDGSNESDTNMESESTDNDFSDEYEGDHYFHCKECNTQFTRKENLKRHEETVHVQNKLDFSEKYSCYICGKIFSRQDNLNEHVNRVHLEKGEKFSCEYCGKMFDRKFNRNRHEVTCSHNPEITRK